MKKSIVLIIAALFNFCCKNSSKTTNYNKDVINCSLTYNKPVINTTNSFENIEVSRIRYLSDSLEISGYIIKPKSLPENEKLPLIIYNRGGNRDYGVNMQDELFFSKHLSSFGYVVMASQYRGNSFSEGVDEFGGNDVNDIKCLIEIAKNIDYIDHNNIGVIGFSRGGLMAYNLSRQSDAIKTVIVVGGSTDLFLASKNRPNLYKHVFLELIGDTITNRQDYINRSSVYWANQLNEPLLILHGTADKSVNIKHAEKLVDSLKKYSKNKVSHYFIEGGNHALSNYRQVRNDTILSWFNHYLKN